MNQTKNTAVAKPGTASQSGRIIGYWIDPATSRITSTRVEIGGAE